MPKTFKIELTVKDFKDILECRIYDDVEWDSMNKAEKAKFHKDLEAGIVKQLSKQSYLDSLKEYLLEMYEETDLDEFNNLREYLAKDANKRIDAEQKAAEKAEAIQTKAVASLREKALYEKLKKKYK